MIPIFLQRGVDKSAHVLHVLALQAPEGTTPDVVSQLASCFVSDTQLCENANSKFEQVQQEQQQLRSLVDELKQQRQNDQLQQQRLTDQLQQSQQENEQLRQQLVQAQAQQQDLQTRLDAATAAGQVLEVQHSQLQQGV
jgi:septal ring factor EnvC (AmiA/AmiB activator)